MTPTVSVVVPTIGRPSLRRAVQSVLEQTVPALEIVVVVDGDERVDLPADDRVIVLHTSFRSGPAIARQTGIDAVRGSVIAMLDDDDEWYPAKLEQQLLAVDSTPGPVWVASSRIEARGPGARRRTWPRRLIRPQQSVPDYLFRFTDFMAGGAELQTSTLLFPTALARAVRWDTHAGCAHDEPSWLMRAQLAFPDLQIIQVPEVLSVYNVEGTSVSRQPVDRTDDYIDWGLEYLAREPARVLGDYFCTYPVSAAVSARSMRGLGRSLLAAVRHGRPGPWALTYAMLNGLRILVVSAETVIRR